MHFARLYKKNLGSWVTFRVRFPYRLTQSSDNAQFHKEYLLNEAINALPPYSKYVAWVDGDILFTNDNWVADTVDALKHRYKILQPFAFSIRLPCGEVWRL